MSDGAGDDDVGQRRELCAAGVHVSVYEHADLRGRVGRRCGVGDKCEPEPGDSDGGLRGADGRNLCRDQRGDDGGHGLCDEPLFYDDAGFCVDRCVWRTAAGNGTYNQGLVVANQYTLPQLVNLSAGVASVTNKVGPTTTTYESAKLNSIANTLAACVNSAGETSATETVTACGQLFAATAPPGGGARPNDTLQAAVAMALYPYQNVTTLYNLASAAAPFVGLAAAPNDWTLAVSYTSTGFGLGIDGSASAKSGSNLDVDAAGNVWFPSNSVNSHGIGEFSPYSGQFAGPFLTALVHPQYVAVTQQGLVYASDTRAPQIAYATVTSPGGGTTVMAATGYTGPIQAAYAAGPADAVVYTGGGTAAGLGKTLYQNLGGTVSTILTYAGVPANIVSYGVQQDDVDAATNSSTACRYESDTTGTLGTQSSTSASPCFAGGVANDGDGQDGVVTISSTNQLCNYGYGGTGTCFTSPVKLSTPQAVESDGDDNIWVANSGNASVSTLVDRPASNGSTYTAADYQRTSTVPYIHDLANGGTMTSPYGLAIDQSGNVWVSNAGCVSTDGTVCSPGPFVLTELIGAGAPTITPLALVEIDNGTNRRPGNPDAVKRQSRGRSAKR